jgi:hypothetical protein
MRPLIAAALLLAAQPALAFDGAKAVENYYEVRGDCRIGVAEDPLNATEAEVAESRRQCDILEELGKELRENGYCWDRSEVVWYICEPQSS